jgi:hypothetical protein
MNGGRPRACALSAYYERKQYAVQSAGGFLKSEFIFAATLERNNQGF